jgi:transcriptional regulator GlxA family with amidase domain
MKHITIFVHKGINILSRVVGPYKVFNRVNSILVQTGLQPFYQVEVVGTELVNSQYDDIFSVNCEKTFDQIENTDLIVIPACQPECLPEMLLDNKEAIKWIRDQHLLKGTEIASLCVGAFFLASTGLINGKQCATHWAVADSFRTMFPEVNLVDSNVIVDTDGFYSSGGAYSFLNLLIHLVEKFNGKEIAILLAKQFQIEYSRDNQNQFAMFFGQKQHEDHDILKTQLYIESNFQDKISVDELANMVAVSKRNFIRRFKSATSNTPLEYIQKVKVEAAKRQLETENIGINDVMYSVGYNDAKSFRELFRRVTGLSPNDYKLRYNRAAVVV